jgi:hypothetical protein
MNQLLDWERADERGELEAVIAEAKALDEAVFTSAEWALILDYIETAEERLT